MKIQFYTPAAGVPRDSFGCASFGFPGAEDPNAINLSVLPYELEGDLICGTYAECLSSIPDKVYQAAIVMLGNAGGENAFIHDLQKKLSVPIVGGGAAIHPVTGEKALITGRGEAAVFLICDDRYRFEVCCENIHHDILSEHSITFTNPRQADTIDGVEAAAWLAEKKAAFDLPLEDFEHLTLSDRNGINAHLSLVDGKICSGRDLQEKMLLRYVPADKVYDRMRVFYDDPNAVVFGCAGLKGILPMPLAAKSTGLYLFGEVCTNDGVSEFGNLMLSKLRIIQK